MTDETHSVPVASQVNKWFELVVEGEELEDQASTQETKSLMFALYIKQKSSSSLGKVRVDYTSYPRYTPKGVLKCFWILSGLVPVYA